MSIAEKLTQIAENEQRVYSVGYEKGKSEGFDAGKQSEYDAFWDSFQQNGNRVDYSFAFAGDCWNDDNLKPKYPIVPRYVEQMFYCCDNIHKLPENIDCSNVDLNRGAHAMFFTCNQLQKIYDIKLPALKSYEKVFGSLPCVTEIEVIRTEPQTVWGKALSEVTNLKNLTIDGKIGTNINVSRCTQLTHDSLMSIINALEDKNPEKTIKGRWILNENLVWQDWMDDYITVFDEHQFGFGYTFNINYTYKGTSQTSLYIGNSGIGYSIRLVQLGSFSNIFYPDNSEWQIAANRTIDFGNAPVSMPEHFYEFITANATSDGGEILNNNSATYTATLGAANLAKLTESEIAIATQKGWTLA